MTCPLYLFSNLTKSTVLNVIKCLQRQKFFFGNKLLIFSRRFIGAQDPIHANPATQRSFKKEKKEDLPQPTLSFVMYK